MVFLSASDNWEKNCAQKCSWCWHNRGKIWWQPPCRLPSAVNRQPLAACHGRTTLGIGKEPQLHPVILYNSASANATLLRFLLPIPCSGSAAVQSRLVLRTFDGWLDDGLGWLDGLDYGGGSPHMSTLVLRTRRYKCIYSGKSVQLKIIKVEPQLVSADSQLPTAKMADCTQNNSAYRPPWRLFAHTPPLEAWESRK